MLLENKQRLIGRKWSENNATKKERIASWFELSNQLKVKISVYSDSIPGKTHTTEAQSSKDDEHYFNLYQCFISFFVFFRDRSKEKCTN